MRIIYCKASFTKGLLLMASFACVFVLIMSPLFTDKNGKPQNGLEYSDDLFNTLSKGSSYFIPEVQKTVDSFKNTNFDVAVALKKSANQEDALAILNHIGVTALVVDGEIAIQGNLHNLLNAAVAVSEQLYANNAAAVTEQYGIDGRHVGMVMWDVLGGMIKPLQRQDHIKEAQAVDLVIKKAIEPGYNFYGIEAAKVMDKVGIMTALLVFYVLYTVWYGFAIFNLFDGIGLTMKKSKVKQEA